MIATVIGFALSKYQGDEMKNMIQSNLYRAGPRDKMFFVVMLIIER
jgi:hypothetical protein